MDKNTLTGLFLIGLVLLGFSWLNNSNAPASSPTTVDTLRNEIELKMAEVTKVDSVGGLLAMDSVSQSNLPMYMHNRSERVVELNNKKLSVKISNKGAMPVEVVLADYKDQSGSNVSLFRSGDSELNLPIRTIHNTILETKDIYFEVLSASSDSVVMRMPIEAGSHMDVVYRLRPDDYRLDMQVLGKGLDRLMPINTASQDLEWNIRMPQQEQSWKFEGQYSGIYYYSTSGSHDDLSTSSREEEKVSDHLRWVAFKDKYFSSVLIGNGNAFEDNTLTIEAEKEGSGYVRSCGLRASFPFHINKSQDASFTFFFGPNDFALLSSYDEGLQGDEKLQLDHLVYLGVNVFRWINRWLIIPVVSFLSEYISNWGIIILLLTLFIKLLLSPFTFKSYMSQAKMRLLKPQVDEIKASYPGEGQDMMMKRQQETMALYSAAGASPMSGCLPMLLQMPFLIALYMYFPTSILLRGESFLWAKDLSTYDPIISWDFNIPIIGGLLGNHISLFCLLMTVVNLVYQRYMMNQSSSSSETMPGMSYMPYIMSIMFFFMFNQNASGLSYYYFISTLITIIQYLVFNYTLDKDKVLAQMEENKKKPRKKSKWQERLEEAQRLQQQQRRK